ncbi:putative phosphoheptose isomerase [Desulfosarcina variabilis str. Montpellier]|uniref:SIS domain-containing protein n=1 Tax=Desulfosarcina variabilis TaxID=2300 RepID=UPI003AFA6678
MKMLNEHHINRALYSSYLGSLQIAMEKMVVTDQLGNSIDQEAALMELCKMCHETKVGGATMYFAGNGASATMASHMAADFSKNCRCRAMAFNDIAMMTAVSNDIHYEECFAVPLTRFAVPGDMLVTISCSGNSPNIIKVVKRAREIGLRIVTLSGMASDNLSRSLGDWNFWIPADTYGLVEASHQVLLHCWLDTYLELHGEDVVEIK